MNPASPSVAAARVFPVDLAQRIALLDILRGLALFGMILVHFHQKMRLPATGLEGVIGWVVWVLVEQKAHGTFAFLFGVGFAVLLRRLESRGAPVVTVYLRRLAALALFGLVAEVLFGFRILFDYAFWGVALLFIRRWSTRTLLIIVVVAFSAVMVMIETMALYQWWTAAAPPHYGNTGLGRAVREAAQRGDYAELVRARWALFTSARLPRTWGHFLPDMTLALFILGLLALRHGVIEEPRRHVRLITRVMLFGALSWGASRLAMVVQPMLPKMPVPGMEWPLLFAFGFIADQWLCLTYIGAIMLLLAYRPQWTARLAVFGQAGRMAFTNYMLQIAVLDVLASGYGFALKLRPVTYLGAAIVLFSIEAAFSRVWLSHFRFGPLEWVWRSLTYLRVEPLRGERVPHAGAMQSTATSP